MPSRLRLAHPLGFALLAALAPPAAAVVRHAALESPRDTLVLQPKEASDFRFRRLAGTDLHYTGLYLGLAAVPLAILAPFMSEGLGMGSPISDAEEGFFFLVFAALPAASAVMAGGNLAYASAARYHAEREFAITRSPVPLIAIASAAGKLFWFATHPDLADTRGGERAALLAFAFTEVLTMPLLRSQFGAASAFLEQVDIKVAGQGGALGFRADF